MTGRRESHLRIQIESCRSGDGVKSSRDRSQHGETSMHKSRGVRDNSIIAEVSGDALKYVDRKGGLGRDGR